MIAGTVLFPTRISLQVWSWAFLRAFLFAASLAALSFTSAAPKQHPAPKPVRAVTDPELDGLFSQLAKASSQEEAKPIEEEILTFFLQSGSPSVDLLMTRAAEAANSGDASTARRILQSVTEIAPLYAEGWHQRGRLEATAGDDEGAIVSLERAVTLNPRQFAAMSELGGILVEYGDKRDALAMLRRALAIDHYLPDVDHEVQRLSRDVEGERI